SPSHDLAAVRGLGGTLRGNNLSGLWGLPLDIGHGDQLLPHRVGSGTIPTSMLDMLIIGSRSSLKRQKKFYTRPRIRNASENTSLQSRKDRRLTKGGRRRT